MGLSEEELSEKELLEEELLERLLDRAETLDKDYTLIKEVVY